MANVAFEIFETRPVREVSFGGEAKAAVQKSRGDSRAIIAFNQPLVCGIIPCCRSDPRAIDCVLADVKYIVDMLKILL